MTLEFFRKKRTYAVNGIWYWGNYRVFYVHQTSFIRKSSTLQDCIKFRTSARCERETSVKYIKNNQAQLINLETFCTEHHFQVDLNRIIDDVYNGIVAFNGVENLIVALHYYREYIITNNLDNYNKAVFYKNQFNQAEEHITTPSVTLITPLGISIEKLAHYQMNTNYKIEYVFNESKSKFYVTRLWKKYDDSFHDVSHNKKQIQFFCRDYQYRKPSFTLALPENTVDLLKLPKEEFKKIYNRLLETRTRIPLCKLIRSVYDGNYSLIMKHILEKTSHRTQVEKYILSLYKLNKKIKKYVKSDKRQKNN